MARGTVRLLVSCADQKGLIAAVAGFIAEHGGNFLDADQHTDAEHGEFLMRVEVEEAGFDFMWVPDTPLLAGRWRDVYIHLACAALSTEKLRLGPGVTNPITRHPVTVGSAIVTLDEVSDGRAEVPYGTGYSSAYIIGRKATTLKLMREAAAMWRGPPSAVSTKELPAARATSSRRSAAGGPKSRGRDSARSRTASAPSSSPGP